MLQLRGLHVKHAVQRGISCPLFKAQLKSVGLAVPHRKHITSPLRAQQVNVIYRFVMMVY
jgi:hypothetical protein